MNGIERMEINIPLTTRKSMAIEIIDNPLGSDDPAFRKVSLKTNGFNEKQKYINNNGAIKIPHAIPNSLIPY